MKYILILLLTLTSLFANESTELADKLSYLKSYDKALLSAQKEQKLMMLIIVEDGCHWCKKFANTTLSNKDVQSKLQTLTKVIIDKEDDAAFDYEPHFFPMIYFINPQTQEVIDTAYGYQKKEGLLKHLQKANENMKRKK